MENYWNLVVLLSSSSHVLSHFQVDIPHYSISFFQIRTRHYS